MKDTADSTRGLGLVIALRELGVEPRENRSFIDYEEIDRLYYQAGRLSSSLPNAGGPGNQCFPANPQWYSGVIVDRHLRSCYRAPDT